MITALSQYSSLNINVIIPRTADQLLEMSPDILLFQPTLTRFAADSSLVLLILSGELDSKHDSATNGPKSRRTGGSSGTGRAGGHRTASGVRERGPLRFCHNKLSGSFHLLFSCFSSFLSLS